MDWATDTIEGATERVEMLGNNEGLPSEEEWSEGVVYLKVMLSLTLVIWPLIFTSNWCNRRLLFQSSAMISYRIAIVGIVLARRALRRPRFVSGVILE